MSIEIRGSQFVSFRDEPFDAIAELAQGWDMDYHQLAAGPNPSDLTQLRLSGVDVALERVEQRVAVWGSPPPDSVAFGLKATAGAGWVFKGSETKADTLVLMRPNEEFDLQYEGELLSFVLDADQLAQRLGQSVFRAVLARDRMTLAARDARALRRLSRTGLAAFRARPQLLTSPVACAEMADRVQTRLVKALSRFPGVQERARRPGPRPARIAAAEKADAFIRGHLHKRLTVGDLVHVTDVKERALRSGFVERFGHSPKSHITTLRLNAVRHALRDCALSDSVTRIASRFGIWHFGRFACQYRALFGELPSATLRNRNSA